MSDIIDILSTENAERSGGEHLMERRLLRSYVDGLPNLIKADRLLVETFQKHHPDDFTNPAHQQVFRAMQHVSSNQGGVDALVLQKTLRDGAKDVKQGQQLDAVVEQILGETPFPATGIALEQAQKLQKDGNRRRSLAVLHKVESAVANGADPAKAFAQIYDFALEERAGTSMSIPTRGDLIYKLINTLEKRQLEGNTLSGMKSGFPYLDGAFNGLKPGLHFIGGMPGTGKTALAVQLADQIAEENECTVLYLTWEPTEEEILIRSASRMSGISISTLEAAHLTKEEATKLGKVAASFPRRTGIVIPVEGWQLTIDDLPLVCRIHKAQAKKLAVVVDYIQIVPGGQGTDVRGKLDYVVTALNRLAKELDAPIILLSALNREGTKPGDAAKTPAMAAFKESSAIEYNATTASILQKDDKDPEQIKMYMVKVRGPGQGKMILFDFDRETGAFEEKSEPQDA